MREIMWIYRDEAAFLAIAPLLTLVAGFLLGRMLK